MENPQIDVTELCQALGVEYDTAKSASFYLMLVKQYRFRYEAAQQSAHPTPRKRGENPATWVFDPKNIKPPEISG